jgi:hypothetical protein
MRIYQGPETRGAHRAAGTEPTLGDAAFRLFARVAFGGFVVGVVDRYYAEHAAVVRQEQEEALHRQAVQTDEDRVLRVQPEFMPAVDTAPAVIGARSSAA